MAMWFASDRHDDAAALGVSLHFVEVEGQMVQNYGTKSRHERKRWSRRTVQQFSFCENKTSTGFFKLVGPDQIKSRRVEVKS